MISDSWSRPSASARSNSESDDIQWDVQSNKNFNFDSIEDVSHAIDACKKSILETDENTESRKEMVLRLIKLRICHEDLKERLESNGSLCYDARGHSFASYQNLPTWLVGFGESNRIYCQQCCYGIWVHLQASQHCKDCGFSVHSACMNDIMRGCVAQKVRVQPDFIMNICPEKTLKALKYRCVECDVKIVGASTRLCDYTGLSFCANCHWNATSPTPARIVHNWDFEERPVSQATKQYLFLMKRKPVIDVRKENPKLFAVVQELAHVDHLRRNLMLMKKYLVVCRIASEQKILLRLVARQHFVDGPHIYSLQDLLDVKSGAIAKFLEKVVAEFVDHIYNCPLCLAKGFICEICDNKKKSVTRAKNHGRDDVTFPFSEDSKTCPECEGVFHRDCFKQVPECPKCKRKVKSAK